MLITAHSIVEMLVIALLIIGAVAIAGFAIARARGAQMSRPRLMGALGGTLFLVSTLGLSAFLNDPDRMPRWFLQINEGAVRFSIIAAFSFALNLALLALVIRRQAAEPSQQAQATGPGQARVSPEAGSGPVFPPPEKLPFSWAAAGLPVIWLMFHGRIVQGFALLALALLCAPFLDEFVPVLVYLIVSYAIAIWLGAWGGRIAWAHRRTGSVEELRQRERGWEVAGKILFWIFALTNAAALLYQLFD